MTQLAAVRAPQRRFTTHTPPAVAVKRMAADHPAVVEGRTIYPSTVLWPTLAERVLKSGHNSRKIGDSVAKGRWRGMPIYTLTLEERRTCPRSCAQWRSCFGNKMHLAERFMHGRPLEARLERELAALQTAHPGGFVVRLHILGDFYSLAYAVRWAGWLDAFPALRVFGYSAWRLNTPIGIYLRALSGQRWDRFAVRFSGTGLRERSAVVVHGAADAGDAIVCPAQTGRADCCGTCGLCWQTRRNIAFLEH